MIFSSHIFLLCFLPLFLAVYFLVPTKGRNLVLLLASVVFYAWGAPDFVLILLAFLASGVIIVLQQRFNRKLEISNKNKDQLKIKMILKLKLKLKIIKII